MKTSLAPGSRVVMDYYERAGLLALPRRRSASTSSASAAPRASATPGPLDPAISAAARTASRVAAVLSGNRNFEGRINPDVRMNYLASPPLVVAYALAGTMDIDLTSEPLGIGSDGTPVILARPLADAAEVQQTHRATRVRSDMFTDAYGAVFDGRRTLEQPRRADRRSLRSGTTPPPTSASPPFFDGMTAAPAPLADITGARVPRHARRLVTTDHISPAGSIAADSPGRASGSSSTASSRRTSTPTAPAAATTRS